MSEFVKIQKPLAVNSILLGERDGRKGAKLPTGAVYKKVVHSRQGYRIGLGKGDNGRVVACHLLGTVAQSEALRNALAHLRPVTVPQQLGDHACKRREQVALSNRARQVGLAR